MKNSWTNTFSGYMRIKVVGKYNELFLNKCIHEQVTIWQIRRVGDEAIVCYISLKDISKLRKIVKEARVKVYFIEKKGVPFLFKKMISRSGVVLGINSFILILFVLSNMVWNITIEGATPKVEHQLVQTIHEMGIKRGKFQFLLPNVEHIQKQVTDQIPEATWIGVTLNGTTYHFRVVEQTLPEKEAPIAPRHLVAKKKAIIHDIYVEQGQGRVKPNDFVREGELLISGFIGKEEKYEVKPAKGTVLGEIWYKSTVTVPLVNEFSTLTGEKKTKHYVSIFDVAIPVWGFGAAKFSDYEVNESKHQLRFLKWSLPIYYQKKVLLEKEKEVHEYTEKEAVNKAMAMAREQLQKKLGLKPNIKGEKVLHQTIENGKVKLLIHYQVIEDITQAQPIIQGD